MCTRASKMDNKHTTFNELLDDCTWIIIQGIVNGENLRSVVRRVMLYTMAWKDTEKEAEK